MFTDPISQVPFQRPGTPIASNIPKPFDEERPHTYLTTISLHDEFYKSTGLKERTTTPKGVAGRL